MQSILKYSFITFLTFLNFRVPLKMAKEVYLSVENNELEIPFMQQWSDPNEPLYENLSLKDLESLLNEEFKKLGAEFENLKTHFSSLSEDAQNLHTDLDIMINSLSERDKFLKSKKTNLLDFISSTINS